MVRVAEPVPAEFVASIVTALTPSTVGVPEITPVLIFTDKPKGRFAAAYVVGLLEALMVYENGTLTVAAAVNVPPITGATTAEAIVITSCSVSVPPAFVAPIVTFAVPDAAGVPVMAPVVVLIDRPVGSPVAE
jgi:hypothetical protein